MASDYLLQTLEHYRQQKTRLIEQLRTVEIVVRQMELELGESPTELPAVDLFSGLGGLPMELAERKPLTNGGRHDVRGDEFFGKSQAEASRLYLSKVGHALAFEELVKVLNNGGCPVGGADPKKTLYIALLRNSKDFIRIPNNGHVGLRSMYPGLRAPASEPAKAKTTKAKKRAPKSSRPVKRITAAKGPVPVNAESVTGGATESKPPRQSAPVKTTIREILADGEFYAGDSIVRRVQEKLGSAIQKVTVYGILKNEKEFERRDDQFRLVQITTGQSATA